MAESTEEMHKEIMSRSERLLALIQLFRQHRRPVSGAVLAEELGISLRTLYRDIATLRDRGAPIEGEAGFGYVLGEGYLLPPLMFSAEEVEALVLGMRFVSKRTDAPLAKAAASALARIAAVLPQPLVAEIDAAGLIVGPPVREPAAGMDLAMLRKAMREEKKLVISYRDRHAEPSLRIVWPFALAFFDDARVLAAWCETRRDFRHFRADRISALAPLEQRYPRRRQVLLKEWRQTVDNRPPS